MTDVKCEAEHLQIQLTAWQRRKSCVTGVKFKFKIKFKLMLKIKFKFKLKKFKAGLR